MELKTCLKDFQINSVNRMIEFEKKYDGGMLLNDTGLGKSICCLSLIIKSNVEKTLIICPSGVVDNWMNEIQKHTTININNVIKYCGPNRYKLIEDTKVKDVMLFITSYSIIGRDNQKDLNFLNTKFDRIILDEAHYIRNNLTKIHKNIIKLGDNLKCKKWIMTATPFFNAVDDIYSYFRFLQLEGIDSRNEWTNRIKKNIDGFHLLNQWVEKYSICYKKEILNLKEKVEKKIILEFDKEQQEFYNALCKYSVSRMKLILKKISLLKKSKNHESNLLKKLFHSNVMVHILRLKQSCNSPYLIMNKMERIKKSKSITEAIGNLQFFTDTKNLEEECTICYDKKANYISKNCGHKSCFECWQKMFNFGINSCHICRTYVDIIEEINEESNEESNEEKIEEEIDNNSIKIKEIQKMIKDITSKDEKIIIVSQYTSMLDLIKKQISIDSIDLRGSVPMKSRTELIDKFEKNTHIKICYLSLMSSSEGINLVSANHLVFIDHWWNNAKMKQCADRIYRIGQVRNVFIYNLQIKNTIEEKIEELTNKKEKTGNLVLKKWNIKDKSKYNLSWISNLIKLIEK